MVKKIGGKVFVLLLGTGADVVSSSCFPVSETDTFEFGGVQYHYKVHQEIPENPDALLDDVQVAQVIVICFSMQDQNSLFEIMDKWHPLLTSKGQRCQILLIGVYRDPDKTVEVKVTQGRALSTILESEFIEFSSETNIGEIMEKLGNLASVANSHDTLKQQLQKRATSEKRFTRYKKEKLAEEKCYKGNLIDLVQLSTDKRYNMHAVEGSRKSPFAVALLAGNLKFAEFFLVFEKGTADMSNLLLDTIPLSLLHWELSPIRELNLSNNRLNCIPPELREIEKVQTEGNPLLCFPPSLRKAKWPKIQEYLRSISSGKASWNVRKVIILGEEAAGKTTLTQSLSTKHGKTDTSVNLSTDGIAMKELKLKNKKKKVSYTINLWDFGGQIIYYPTHQFFLSAHSAYIIVFDYSDVRYQRLEYWFKQLKSHCSTSIVAILVGTHTDLCTEESIADTTRKLAAQFPRQQYPFFSGEIYPVSCATGAGIQELKSALLNICEHSLLSPDCPVRWTYFYNLLYAYSRVGVDRVGWKLYEVWARTCGIHEQNDILKATSLFEASGILVHLRDHTEPLENSQVILSAQWLADIMSTFITTRANFVNNGILNVDDVPKILAATDKYPPSLHSSILSLLEKFRILYRLQDRFIIPSMLPVPRPGHQISSLFPSTIPPTWNTVGRIFQFPSMPLGFFERLAVALLANPSLEIKIAWKLGVLLTGEECLILVEYNEISYELSLLFRYLVSKREVNVPIFSNILAAVTNMIAGFYPGLQELTKEYIICPHCIRFGCHNESAWRFSKETVVKLLEKQSEEQDMLHCNDMQGITRTVAPSQAAPDLSLGAQVTVIPKSMVELGEPIGKGGFGVVYSGTISGTKVAIKQLVVKAHQHKDSTRQYSEFLSEASVMSHLDNPNIVKLFGVMDNPKAMVLEYVGGGDLFELLHPEEVHQDRKKLKQTDLPWQQRITYALNISEGLEYLQSISPPIVHRDLRSPNIFLTDDKQNALIGDFGLALQVHNQVGGVLKTWQWLAPEVISSESSGYNEKSDTFSLGIILWELATLEVPYDEYRKDEKYFHSELGEWKLQAIKTAIIEENLRPFIPNYVPEYYQNILHRCWLPKPNDRITPHEICNILRRFCRLLLLKTPTQNRSRFNLIVEETQTNETKITPTNSIRPQDIMNVDEYPTCMLPVSSAMLMGTKSGKILVFLLETNPASDTNFLVLQDTLTGHQSPVTLLLFTGLAVWSCGRDGSMSVWEPDNSGSFSLVYKWHPLITSLICPSCMAHVYHKSYGDTVWLGSSSEGKITVWDANSYRCISTITSENLLQCNKIISYKEFVLVAGNRGLVCIFNRATRELVGTFQAHTSQITCITMIRQKNEFWTASNSGEIAMWFMTSLEDLRKVGSSSVHHSKVLSLFYVQRFGQLFSLSFDGSICCWDVHTKHAIEEINDSVDEPIDLSGTSQGHLWTCTSKQVQLWPFDWANSNKNKK